MTFEPLVHPRSRRLRLVGDGPRMDREAMAAEVRAGLAARPRTLLARYFYDEAGSALFEAICRLPEYYPTRTERGILRRHAAEIVGWADGPVELIELGSGSSAKTRLLIQALLRRQPRLHYQPVDISAQMLLQAAERLLDTYPKLSITAHASEYRAALGAIGRPSEAGKLILFLGSNLGNFNPGEAADFLGALRAAMTEADRLLVGLDLHKDRSVLEAAYNDRRGVTARFNMNILVRLNRELGADFALERFRHWAFYNESRERIEMHLVSQSDQRVRLERLGMTCDFAAGETIHTESSHKFHRGGIDRLCSQAGLARQQTWLDDQGWFSVNLLRVAPQAP